MFECNQITKSFAKKTPILANLTWNFSSPFTVLLGSNGVGKSTLFRLMLRFLTPENGSILFENHPIRDEDKKNIGYMPENPTLERELTLLETLQWQSCLQFKKEGAGLLEKLSSVGLTNPHLKIKQCSKGMIRRLLWVCATIHQPKCLILDEPFADLDPKGQLLLAQEMGKLSQEGTSLIVATHFWECIADYTHEWLFLKNAQLLSLTSELKGLSIDERKAKLLSHYE